MHAPTPRHGTRSRALPLAVTLLSAAALAAACATQRAATPAAATRPAVLTVPQLSSRVQMGEAINVLYGEMQISGTVYRMTPTQVSNLRAAGMPVAILSFMELTYQHAIQKNPDLAKSDDKWTQIDGYWYGGLPFGWPRDWVVGAPAPGELLR